MMVPAACRICQSPASRVKDVELLQLYNAGCCWIERPIFNLFSHLHFLIPNHAEQLPKINFGGEKTDLRITVYLSLFAAFILSQSGWSLWSCAFAFKMFEWMVLMSNLHFFLAMQTLCVKEATCRTSPMSCPLMVPSNGPCSPWWLSRKRLAVRSGRCWAGPVVHHSD